MCVISPPRPPRNSATGLVGTQTGSCVPSQSILFDPCTTPGLPNATRGFRKRGSPNAGTPHLRVASYGPRSTRGSRLHNGSESKLARGQRSSTGPDSRHCECDAHSHRSAVPLLPLPPANPAAQAKASTREAQWEALSTRLQRFATSTSEDAAASAAAIDPYRSRCRWASGPPHAHARG
jgi:hypothetical protein